MGDPINIFGWGYGPKHLSHEEIEKMKKSMKKVPEIQLKSDIYHSKELSDIDNILWNLPTTDDLTTQATEQTNQPKKTHSWFISQITLLRQRFISLFS